MLRGERGGPAGRALAQLGILEPPMGGSSGKVQGVWGGEDGYRKREADIPGESRLVRKEAQR